MKALHLSENLPRLWNGEGKFVLVQGRQYAVIGSQCCIFRFALGSAFVLAALVLLTILCAVQAVVQRRDLD